MIKAIMTILQIMNVCGQSNGQTIGGQLDQNNCMIGAGYTWCKSTNNCIRQWETPCNDNFIDCSDCLTKQMNGLNIACPTNCDMVQMPPQQMPPQQMPPQIAIDPGPIRYPTDPIRYPTDPIRYPTDPIMEPPIEVCPSVMCMMYCEYGHITDINGCQMCQCNSELPEPITDTDCILTQPSCDGYTYVCPKITEITNCNMGGIDGYTTYQLSLVIKNNMNVYDIYAIYGTSDNNMIIPPAYNSESEFNSNIGGTLDFIKNSNSNAIFDSWLTIGITDGNINNEISSVGIDFKNWNTNNGIIVTDGAVFTMNPSSKIEDNEYIIGQLTVRTNEQYSVNINVAGKTLLNSGTIDTEMWSDTNVIFPLISPHDIIHDTIPTDCISWYDGCNTCSTNNGILGSCTRMMCFREDNPRCLTFVSIGH